LRSTFETYHRVGTVTCPHRQALSLLPNIRLVNNLGAYPKKGHLNWITLICLTCPKYLPRTNTLAYFVAALLIGNCDIRVKWKILFINEMKQDKILLKLKVKNQEFSAKNCDLSLKFWKKFSQLLSNFHYMNET
jgi:hypothetical protein